MSAVSGTCITPLRLPDTIVPVWAGNAINMALAGAAWAVADSIRELAGLVKPDTAD